MYIKGHVQHSLSAGGLAPGMLEDLIDIVTLLNLAIKHAADKINALFADGKGDA